MAPAPSQPLGGTDAESEGHENREAEEDVEKVQHGMAPWVAVPDTAASLRKGSIREGAGSRKERVKKDCPNALGSDQGEASDRRHHARAFRWHDACSATHLLNGCDAGRGRGSRDHSG
jgi:hypothetical protein